jgi:hypothetical protein
MFSMRIEHNVSETGPVCILNLKCVQAPAQHSPSGNDLILRRNCVASENPEVIVYFNGFN